MRKPKLLGKGIQYLLYVKVYFSNTLFLFCCVDLIDQVLEEDDHDQDGYLSYTEYVVGRQRDSSKKKA